MSIIIEAEHPYSYEDDDGTEISFKQGERFILINKTNADWWKVQRTGLFTGKTVCYVPAAYVKEVNTAPCGEKQNLHVNLDVYKKIITKDFDGLSKLNNKSMVVLKGELEKNHCESEDVEYRVSTFAEGSHFEVSSPVACCRAGRKIGIIHFVFSLSFSINIDLNLSCDISKNNVFNPLLRGRQGTDGNNLFRFSHNTP